MLQQIINQSVWAFLLEAAVFIGVLSKIGAMIHYNRLVSETEQMERVRTKWMKALKKRFDNYGQLKFKVENAETFVDKYMEMDRICGIKSRIFLRIPLVCAVLVMVAACQGEESWMFGTGLNLVAVFLIMELLIDVRSDVSIIKTNLLLSIEKRSAKNRNTVSEKEEPKKYIERRRPQEEIASSKEIDRISREEKEVFGQIMKEWWEF